MIDLHYSATPNGQKIAIMLEEVGEPYRVSPYDIFEGDQLTAAFGRVNPNHKLPAIVDQNPADGGEPVTVFESAAILQYLAEKSGRFLPASGAARAATLSWLTWQVAGLGPMGGQASHFLRYAPAGQDYAIERYTKELKRLLTVLEKRLEKSAYVAGDDYTIADMATMPWLRFPERQGVEINEYPALKRWRDAILERPAAQKALQVLADRRRPGEMSKEQKENLFGATQYAKR